jgi:hypothetical protein
MRHRRQATRYDTKRPARAVAPRARAAAAGAAVHSHSGLVYLLNGGAAARAARAGRGAAYVGHAAGAATVHGSDCGSVQGGGGSAQSARDGGEGPGSRLTHCLTQEPGADTCSLPQTSPALCVHYSLKFGFRHGVPVLCVLCPPFTH